MRNHWRHKLNTTTLVKMAAGPLALTAIAGMTILIPQVHAQDNGASEAAKILIGMQIAPVPLDLKGKDPNLVGFGSYLINATADCNGCHSAGPDTEFVAGGIPYFSQHPTKINPATYLGGGNDFG